MCDTEVSCDTLKETHVILHESFTQEQFKKQKTPFALHFLLLPLNLITVNGEINEIFFSILWVSLTLEKIIS